MSRSLGAFPALILMLVPSVLAADAAPASPEALRKLASDYYRWRNEQYPVFSSDQGLHTGDGRLTDWSAAALAARRAHVRRVLEAVRAAKDDAWPKDDRIDAVLFQIGRAHV